MPSKTTFFRGCERTVWFLLDNIICDRKMSNVSYSGLRPKENASLFRFGCRRVIVRNYSETSK